MTIGRSNELLGYPGDARLLIINADDFGMHHDQNLATIESMTEGVAGSTTVMTPCPGAAEALELLRAHPGLPFGVHLTLVCEQLTHRWGPVSDPASVPTLIDESGMFRDYDRIPELIATATQDDVEREFRAQIETVLGAGLRPTHLDWHCTDHGGSPRILDLTLRLAREYELAMRCYNEEVSARLHEEGKPTLDYHIMDSFGVETEDKTSRYVRMLQELPVGLSEWAVHPSLATAESRVYDPGWEVRRADFEFLISGEAAATIASEGIELLDYRALQAVWAAG